MLIRGARATTRRRKRGLPPEEPRAGTLYSTTRRRCRGGVALPTSSVAYERHVRNTKHRDRRMCSTIQPVLLLGTNVPPLHTTRRLEQAPPPSNNTPTTTQPTATALGTGLPTRPTRTTTGASTGGPTHHGTNQEMHATKVTYAAKRASQNGPVPAQPTPRSTSGGGGCAKLKSATPTPTRG